jgi:hypothetical protein
MQNQGFFSNLLISLYPVSFLRCPVLSRPEWLVLK